MGTAGQAQLVQDGYDGVEGVCWRTQVAGPWLLTAGDSGQWHAAAAYSYCPGLQGVPAEAFADHTLHKILILAQPVATAA